MHVIRHYDRGNQIKRLLTILQRLENKVCCRTLGEKVFPVPRAGSYKIPCIVLRNPPFPQGLVTGTPVTIHRKSFNADRTTFKAVLIICSGNEIERRSYARKRYLVRNRDQGPFLQKNTNTKM